MAPFNRMTRELQLKVLSFSGEAGTFEDWEIGALAGSTAAQMLMLASAQGIQADVTAKHAALVAASEALASALAVIANGPVSTVNGKSQPDDYRWHGADSDFVWIAADNSLTAMDAQTMFAFGQATMAHKQAHIFAARAIKDAQPIPLDYTEDGYWP